jgi:hypothetical protein
MVVQLHALQDNIGENQTFACRTLPEDLPILAPSQRSGTSYRACLAYPAVPAEADVSCFWQAADAGAERQNDKSPTSGGRRSTPKAWLDAGSTSPCSVSLVVEAPANRPTTVGTCGFNGHAPMKRPCPHSEAQREKSPGAYCTPVFVGC